MPLNTIFLFGTFIAVPLLIIAIVLLIFKRVKST